MTSTSSGSRTVILPQSACSWTDRQGRQQAPKPLDPEQGGLEAQRIKNFTGQKQFQPPAAADFANGLLPHGRAPQSQASALQQLGNVMAPLLGAMKRLCGKEKPAPSKVRQAE